MILIDVSGANAVMRSSDTLTVGMVGAVAEFRFDETWEGLSKTAVFRQGDITRDVTGVGSTAAIPPEVLRYAGVPVEIGVYGANDSGSVVIPTVWAKTKPVKEGTDPSGDESAAPELPVWQQIINRMNDMTVRAAVEDEVLVIFCGTAVEIKDNVLILS